MFGVDNSHSGVEFNYEAVDNPAVALMSTHGTISYCSWRVMAKFHYADFPATSPRQSRDVPFNRRLLRRGSFGEVGVMKFGLKGTSRVCRGRHGEVGIVEFGLYIVHGELGCVKYSC